MRDLVAGPSISGVGTSLYVALSNKQIWEITLPECPEAECFLVLGDGGGNQPFTAGAHSWTTQLSGISLSCPVTMADIPVFEIPVAAPNNNKKIHRLAPPEKSKKIRRSPSLVSQFSVQVLMWNPVVFPGNPEQWTRVIQVSLWSNGTATARRLGTRDGMSISMDVFEVDGTRYVRFPFAIDGL